MVEEDSSFSGYNGVDIIKLSFDNDLLDCDTFTYSCVRKKFSGWAKVVAIAPQSDSECDYLL